MELNRTLINQLADLSTADESKLGASTELSNDEKPRKNRRRTRKKKAENDLSHYCVQMELNRTLINQLADLSTADESKLDASTELSNDDKPRKKCRRSRKKKTQNDGQQSSGSSEVSNGHFKGSISAVADGNCGTVIRRKKSGANITFESNKGPIKYTTQTSLLPPATRIANQICDKSNVNKIAAKKYVDQSSSVPKLKLGLKDYNMPKTENLHSGTSMSTDSRKPRKREQPRDKVLSTTSAFEDYMQPEDVETGLLDGSLVKGVLRINPKFYTEAYVSREDKSLQDFFIGSVAERNRALEGDVVVLEIKPESEWRDNQQKAKVVRILEKVHPRVAVGYITLLKDNAKKVVSFQPRDKRIPHMNVDEMSLPPNYAHSPSKYEHTLFLVQMVKWDVPKYAEGMITENIGKSNDLKAETKSILLENQIDCTPFPSEMHKYLPKSKTISTSELNYRADLRKECIFTIDPLTAKDLDDAVSCKQLANGNFEIGVHIADVAFYLAENTPLDEMVSKKATSTYLIDNVYHMLPPEMCLHCSLLPGRDCLAFSVIFEISKEAEIISRRFTRSIINSCSQLAYEHAQRIIEDPNADFNATNFPYVYNSFNIDQIRSTVLNMQSVAEKLRTQRFKNGALRIDQVKLGFHLDPSGNPVTFFTQEIKDANRMIEEYMLLANINVAEKIYESFPMLAFLRCHDKPHIRLLKDVKNTLEIIGMHLNIASSHDLYESLKKYNTNDYLGLSRFIALNHLLAKPMVRARYFCADDDEPEKFHHYALSVPIYTHFTSPIRRYADVMVHRLLAAALGYTGKPNWSVDLVKEIAETCNRQKQNAKKAGEGSSDLYLAYYIEKNQPYITEAVVVNVQEKSFDAITIQTGTLVRIHCNNLGEKVVVQAVTYGGEAKTLWKMSVKFPSAPHHPETVQVIDLFQIIQVSLKRKNKTNKLDANLVRPCHITLPNI